MAEYIDIDAPIDVAVYQRNRRIQVTLRQILESNDAKYERADVRPVVHGEWEHKVTSSYAGGGATFCSVCGYGYSDGAFFEVEDFDYCPHCGATMKVDRRDIELL